MSADYDGAFERMTPQLRPDELHAHASLATTQVYTYVRPARMAEAVALLDYDEPSP